MNLIAAPELRFCDRAAITPHLQQIDEWLLPGAFYGAQHTWPQLYRSDGDGRFCALFDGDRLISHCAFRIARAHTDRGPRRVAMLGSVATDPEFRGQGFAQRVVRASLDACKQLGASFALLWAEEQGLYARCGFRPGADETCCVVESNGTELAGDVVREATIRDHARLCALHEQKPLRLERSSRAMSALLTTPGLSTYVLERDGAVIAYACTGKGADLHGWWHEFGGSDQDVAALLPRALDLAGQPQAIVIVPPYRNALVRELGPACIEVATVAGPMVAALTDEVAAAVFVDGLDSV